MPGLDENKALWDGAYDWPDGGDEWSKPWGGPASEWYATLYPRLRHFLPASTIVEIAPGYGRWTQYLLGHCDHLIGVDLSQECVTACERRFEGDNKAEFHVNDGRSLDMVPGGSADLVFSFDSLVHAEADVLEAYMTALATKLSPDGVAFLHHSNLAGRITDPKIRYGTQLARSVPATMRVVRKLGMLQPTHFRAASMSGGLLAEFATSAGLHCTSQEHISWHGSAIIDCISVVSRPGSRWDKTIEVVENPRFWDEALSAGAAERAYGQS
jgi:hypothetical protein